jgi:hypothetical protein
MVNRLGIDRAKVCGPWPGLPKMSDTLVEFAQPLLDLLPPDAKLPQFRNALSFGSHMWNFCVLDASDTDDDQKHAAELLASLRTEMHRAGISEDFVDALVEELAGRKMTLFPDDQRLIAGVEVRREGDRLFIDAMSVLG